MSLETPAPTANDVAAERFPSHSRYAPVQVITVTEADATERRFLARRFVPQPESTPVVAEHLVVAGDRLDLLAQHYYGDPLLAWRIADANRADNPTELTLEPGRVLKIPAPSATGGFGGEP